MNAITDKVQLNPTQSHIVELHKEFKQLKKKTHRLSDEEELSKKIFSFRRALIKELYESKI